jgi:hypothetical protein
LQAEQVAERNTKHGMYGTRVYEAWSSMWKRCRQPRHKFWKHYGGRGITVCDRWRDFALFYEDMGDHPGGRYSLDRKDCDGNYTPDNCRWATPHEQQSNRRNSRRSP